MQHSLVWLSTRKQHLDLNPHLNHGQDNEKLYSEVWELKQQAGALHAPLLLPVVEPVWYQAYENCLQCLVVDVLLSRQKAAENQLAQQIAEAYGCCESEQPYHKSLVPACSGHIFCMIDEQ